MFSSFNFSWNLYSLDKFQLKRTLPFSLSADSTEKCPYNGIQCPELLIIMKAIKCKTRLRTERSLIICTQVRGYDPYVDMICTCTEINHVQ